MNYLYIKNYLDLQNKDKEAFFNFLKNHSSISLTRQRVVMSENALILDFAENSNINEVKALLDEYLDIYSDLTTHIIEKIVKKSDHLILEFDDKKLRV